MWPLVTKEERLIFAASEFLCTEDVARCGAMNRQTRQHPHCDLGQIQDDWYELLQYLLFQEQEERARREREIAEDPFCRLLVRVCDASFTEHEPDPSCKVQ